MTRSSSAAMHRGQSSLKSAHVLKVANGYLHCSDPVSQSRFLAALEKTALTGQTANLLVYPIGEPEHRFSMTLANMQRSGNNHSERRSPHVFQHPVCAFTSGPAEVRHSETAHGIVRAVCRGSAPHPRPLPRELARRVRKRSGIKITYRADSITIGLGQDGNRAPSHTYLSCCRDSRYSLGRLRLRFDSRWRPAHSAQAGTILAVDRR
jgi:hypothetical protein